MKKTYIEPEIKVVTIPMRLLVGSPTMNFKQDPDDNEDDEVDDFNQLL